MEARLRELWGTTLSAREIGKEFDMSRNAIIGKARRLKLAHRAPTGAERIKGGRKTKRKRIAKVPVREMRAFFGGRLLVEKVQPPVTTGISIMELENHHCREIVGRGPDQLARYCGHPKLETGTRIGGRVFDSAYCLGHALVNYRST